jgi:hypothetical protein
VHGRCGIVAVELGEEEAFGVALVGHTDRTWRRKGQRNPHAQGDREPRASMPMPAKIFTIFEARRRSSG